MNRWERCAGHGVLRGTGARKAPVGTLRVRRRRRKGVSRVRVRRQRRLRILTCAMPVCLMPTRIQAVSRGLSSVIEPSCVQASRRGFPGYSRMKQSYRQRR
ncbi:hypothetical protein FM105_00690 [Brevibacterium yomogidense]|uniref:Uncharacterized protein n=1 Tax=Brevibacterium yomogidense TaxID=946573 RepID=A0A1X6WTW9_9MICO|nr:hypothetical protein FM105_00690 [Brevibacterium yomogidense]